METVGALTILKAIPVFVPTKTGPLFWPQYFRRCGYVSNGNVEWNGENWSRLGT